DRLGGGIAGQLVQVALDGDRGAFLVHNDSGRSAAIGSIIPPPGVTPQRSVIQRGGEGAAPGVAARACPVSGTGASEGARSMRGGPPTPTPIRWSPESSRSPRRKERFAWQIPYQGVASLPCRDKRQIP